VKKSKVIRTIGNKKEVVEKEYIEISGDKLNKLIQNVQQGEDEIELRKKLIDEVKKDG